jgi:hypothetical protein
VNVEPTLYSGGWVFSLTGHPREQIRRGPRRNAKLQLLLTNVRQRGPFSVTAGRAVKSEETFVRLIACNYGTNKFKSAGCGDGLSRALLIQSLSSQEFLREKTGPIMLHKCANPACKVPFRSLREGKLFLAETFPSDVNTPIDGTRRKLHRREHFWLCNICSTQFTLRFDPTLGMLAVPFADRPNPRFLTPSAVNA